MLFVCPKDHEPLTDAVHGLSCTFCSTFYPVVRGVPVLINEANSVFEIASYLDGSAYKGASGYAGTADQTSGLRRAYREFARRLSEADVPGFSFDPMPAILAEYPDGEILVIGSGEREIGGRVTYTDVAFSKNVDCICDAHDLPFPDASFDAVWVEAVMEHVCDPQRCAAEILRVLRPGGFVWSVTPFLQPVHMGAHDFTRFTHLGHRRLYRWFDEVKSGMMGGPGYSAVHLVRDLFLVLSDRPRVRSLLRLAALLITFPLRYLDPLLTRTEGSFNAGCAFYFLGRKRSSPIPDREIIGLFRGR